MSATMLKGLVVALTLTTAFALPQGSPAGTATASSASGPTPTDNTELISKLTTDPTMIKRYRRLLTADNGKQLLSPDDLSKATVFDFNSSSFPVGGTQGGHATMASALYKHCGLLTNCKQSGVEQFPFLIHSGIAAAMATVGACGFVIPAVHPRANEYFVTVEGEFLFGTQLETRLLSAGPTPEINGKLSKYQGTLFPQGSVHYQINNSSDCTPSTFFSAFSSEDFGTTVILNSPPVSNGTAITKRIASADDLDGLRPVTPAKIVSIVDHCLARCGAGKE